MKNILKFKFQGKEGFLSVVEKADQYYALIQKDSPKVIEIQKTKKLLISYELKEPMYKEVLVNVLNDQALTQWVYDKLEADNNLYFKNLDDHLCVIEIAKE